jgi:hypothetical protein
MVSQCDRVIAGNRFLGELAIRAGARPAGVRVIPTCLELERYPPPSGSPREGRELARLVWIGSSSTLRGLESSRPLWDHLGREFPGLVLRVICDRYPDLGALAVERVAWDPRTEASALGEADIGVSWLPDDLWSRGKCGLKVLQYQASGLPVLASPVGVHHEMVIPGRSGYLPDSPRQWVSTLSVLLRDSALRSRMGRQGRLDLEAGYSTRRWGETLLAALTPADRSSAGTTRRVWERATPHGTRSPAAALEHEG